MKNKSGDTELTFKIHFNGMNSIDISQDTGWELLNVDVGNWEDPSYLIRLGMPSSEQVLAQFTAFARTFLIKRFNYSEVIWEWMDESAKLKVFIDFSFMLLLHCIKFWKPIHLNTMLLPYTSFYISIETERRGYR